MIYWKQLRVSLSFSTFYVYNLTSKRITSELGIFGLGIFMQRATERNLRHTFVGFKAIKNVNNMFYSCDNCIAATY